MPESERARRDVARTPCAAPALGIRAPGPPPEDAPSRGSTPSQAAPAPRRIEVIPPRAVVGRTRAPADPSDARLARDAYIRVRPTTPERSPLLCRTKPLRPVALVQVALISTQRHYRRGTAPLTCSLDHRRAPRAAHSFAPTATSPEQWAPRLTPVAATARPPPAPPPRQTPVGIEPRDPSSRPPPAPSRSRPPVRRNLTGLPPAGA
jgi:hypothetical protein